jgi:BlaI family transcriptional regulator, penicillinase repressor
MSLHPGTRRQQSLTNAELKLMLIVWRLGRCTAGDVRAQLSEVPAPAYTTLATILTILRRKGVLTGRREGRQTVYEAAISKRQYQVHLLSHLIDSVFDGNSEELMERLKEARCGSKDW